MIQHRLIYSIIDTATSIEKVHEEIAELDVTKRNSIGDRDALRLLYGVIKEQLVPGGGSTAAELAAMQRAATETTKAAVEAYMRSPLRGIPVSADDMAIDSHVPFDIRDEESPHGASE